MRDVNEEGGLSSSSEKVEIIEEGAECEFSVEETTSPENLATFSIPLGEFGKIAAAATSGCESIRWLPWGAIERILYMAAAGYYVAEKEGGLPEKAQDHLLEAINEGLAWGEALCNGDGQRGAGKVTPQGFTLVTPGGVTFEFEVWDASHPYFGIMTSARKWRKIKREELEENPLMRPYPPCQMRQEKEADESQQNVILLHVHFGRVSNFLFREIVEAVLKAR